MRRDEFPIAPSSAFGTFELEDEFRVASLPSGVREVFATAVFWPLAVQRAIAAGQRNLDQLTNIAFFMHHPERIVGGIGRALDLGEPQFAKLSAEWKGLRTLVAPMLKAPSGGAASPSASGGTAVPEVNTLLDASAPGLDASKPASHRYGLPETIAALKAIGRSWQAAHPSGPRVRIRDISRCGGGKFSPHGSHRMGIDVDIGLMRSDGRTAGVNFKLQPDAYSAPLTQRLVDTIRGNGVLRVQQIFFADPRVSNVTHDDKHYDHLHVRFCMPRHYDLAALKRAAFPQGTKGTYTACALPGEEFEGLPPAEQMHHEFRSPRRSGGRTTTRPTLTIRVRPFVVLDGFAHQVSTLPAAHSAIVQRLARLVVASRLSRQPLTTIRLVGHTDSTGPEAFNLDFGKARAAGVETRLRAAMAALGTVPTAPLNIVVQSLGETKPVASNATAAGRASNRRVEVFLDSTCHSFFAQYDLRFLPGDPVFGIPAHPNLPNKAQREADVRAVAAELVRRRDQRAAAALNGRVPSFAPLAAGSALRARALRLSSAQLALFREYFDDGRGGIHFAAFRNCFEHFANGQLRSPLAADRAKGVGEPNSDFYFLFAEFGFLCLGSGIAPALWTQALRVFVGTQEIFMHVYRPSPPSLPPPVGAPLPACARDVTGRPRARRALSSFGNRNFRARGASPLVGFGQSSLARRRALAARYAGAAPALLLQRARENLLRAQCMP